MKKGSWKMKLWKQYKKLFPSKCYVVTGIKGIPDKYFPSKKEGLSFLFENSGKYNALMKCAGTGIYRM